MSVNILVLMVDTLRADFLGGYGADWMRTPNIDSLARRGAVFTGCYAEGQPTLQARRALMSGRRTFPWKDDRIVPGDSLNLQPGWQPLNDSDWTLAEVLRGHGYWNGLVTDTAQYFKPGMNFHRGFDTYDFIRGQICDYWQSPVRRMKPKAGPRFSAAELRKAHRPRFEALHDFLYAEEDNLAAQVARRAAQWLLDHRDVEKTFLWVDMFDPHEPWTAPEPYRNLYAREDLLRAPYALSDRPACRSEDEIAAMRGAYAAEITMVDRWIGHVLEALELSGRAADTLVVFHSDHGTPVGHAGAPAKGGQWMYQCQSRNPLIVARPEGLGAGRRIEPLCYNVDLMPTLLELAGAGAPEAIDGRSLVPLLEGKADTFRCCVTSGYNEWIMYRDDEWLLIQRLDGSGSALVDLKADPREERDVAAGQEDRIRRLRQRLIEECGGLPQDPGWSWPPSRERLAQHPKLSN